MVPAGRPALARARRERDREPGAQWRGAAADGREKPAARAHGQDVHAEDRQAREVINSCKSSIYKPPRHRYLISRNSSIPYFDPSRPSPDSLTPPNGATSVEISPVLMPTMPYSSASATRQMRPMSRP